jgi:hypothetical protein
MPDPGFICTLRVGHSDVAVHFSPGDRPSARLKLTVRSPLHTTATTGPQNPHAAPAWSAWQNGDSTQALSMGPAIALPPSPGPPS